MSEKMMSLQDLFLHELSDLYDAEHQLVKAMPKLQKAASTQRLQQAFERHLEQTKQQIQKLDTVFEQLGQQPEKKPCKGMQGLIQEGEEVLKLKGDPATKDAALIAAAQRVEHYEMAAYGTVRDYADKLGLSDVKDLLQQTLDEEGDTDHDLTDLAQSINPRTIH